MSIRSDSWCRHLMPQVARGRMIPNAGMIVPFNSRHPSSYAEMMLKIAAAGEKKDGMSAVPRGKASASAVASASSREDGAGGDMGGGNADGGGGAGGDSDGDGDGDSDGPRRKPSRPKSSRVSAARRRPPSPSKTTLDRAHARALVAFTVVTALLLGTVLVFGLNGQPGLAEKVLSAFVSVATVAAALLRPK